MASDGSIYVAFLNTASLSTGRDQYLVVKVDPDTAARVGGPYKVAELVDGYTDYPINQDLRQTYQDSQLRTWAAGNIAADPANPSHLAVAWSDMRNSELPAPSEGCNGTHEALPSQPETTCRSDEQNPSVPFPPYREDRERNETDGGSDRVIRAGSLTRNVLE